MAQNWHFYFSRITQKTQINYARQTTFHFFLCKSVPSVRDDFSAFFADFSTYDFCLTTYDYFLTFVPMKTVLPSETPQPKFHELLLSSVAPRPIAFVSSIDAQGNVNLSPFSFFNAFGSNPPICVFSPARSGRTKENKNTFENVNEVRECVINIVNEDMLHQMNLASGEYAKGVNEFEKAGFTMLASENVKPPRVAESLAQMECKIINVIETGTGGGAGNLIVAEVLALHISEKVLDENNSIKPLEMHYIGRLGKDFYCRITADNLFEVAKPKSSANLGMGFDNLPDYIRYSKVLTGSDLAQLASLHTIPELTEDDKRIFKTDYSEEQACIEINHNELEAALKFLLVNKK